MLRREADSNHRPVGPQSNTPTIWLCSIVNGNGNIVNGNVVNGNGNIVNGNVVNGNGNIVNGNALIIR